MTGPEVLAVGFTADVTLGLAAAAALLARGTKAPREVCGDCGCCHPARRYEGDGDV